MHSHEGDPGSINAWVRVYEEDAVAAAARADERLSAAGVRRDGPAPVLTGIPVGLKDLYGVAGKPVTASSSLLDDVPGEDCDVWKRLAAAGMVLLGHLHTHEFAAGGTTDQVGNPWDLERSAGGSSGGSAAALAARMVPAATGTDTAGSLRIPSACCGTSAIKPTRGTRLARGSRAAVVEPRPRRPDGAHARRLRAAAPGDGGPRPQAGRRRRFMLLCPMRCPSAQRRGRSRACGSPSPRAPRRWSWRPTSPPASSSRSRRAAARGVARRAAGPAAGFDVGGRLPRRPDDGDARLPPALRRPSRPLPAVAARVGRGRRAARRVRGGVRRRACSATRADGAPGRAGWPSTAHRRDRAHDPGRRAAARGRATSTRAPTTS